MFLNPLGLLALLGVPAVVALHLFRRRFERRKVSALFLWEARSTTSLSGRRRETLLRSPSFWSELLMALLLGFAFAGPRACGTLEAKHLVVVLDGSASMSGDDSESVDTPAELALESLRRKIGDLPSGSRVTVVESGPTPRILIGPAAFPAESVARLDEYEPIAGRHDLAPATTLALEIAGQGAVTLFTDHFEPQALPEQVGVVAVGRPRENMAITRATRLISGDSSSGEEEVLLTVANFSPRQRSNSIELLDGDRSVRKQALELAPGERKHFSFDLPAGAPTLTARLEADPFPIDDEVVLAPAPRRALGLATDLEEEERYFLGLQRAPGNAIGHWLSLVPRSYAAASLESADLVIAHEPVGGPNTWCFEFSADGTARLDLIGPFLIEKRHELLDGVSLDGVVWSAAGEQSMPGTPLISAGNLPLLTEERLPSRRLFHANIDWSRSSLQRTPDWPILLDNLARMRRRELDGAPTTNLALGEVFYFQSHSSAEYRLEGPGETRDFRALTTLAVEEFDGLGLNRLFRDGQEVAEFAVHFGDDAESDLRSSSRGERASSVDLAAERSGSSWVVLLLGALALGAVLLDWWFLRARPMQTWVNKPRRGQT